MLCVKFGWTCSNDSQEDENVKLYRHTDWQSDEKRSEKFISASCSGELKIASI